ncbi:MAG: SDR family NAD(P)-dependent oxidoreductase [Chloroflexi bacterium]|nr:SDR family NAD(P)-dependent oxidoreductase [Chloroflexota bacterium]
MKQVVITGSTRGIGFGLAKEFLKKGCRVVVSGRSNETVQQAVLSLIAVSGSDQARGRACDVTDLEQVQSLWGFAAENNPVDIWINNAGISHLMTPFYQISAETRVKVLNTNLLGMMNGSSVAIQKMQQQGFGALYNLEGLGSNGMVIKGMSIYGTSKAAARYFDKALAEELQGSNLIIGGLQPGMVLTDMLFDQNETSGEEWEKKKKIFNFLSERVEKVTPWLVDKILANRKNGRVIKYSNPVRLFIRMLGVLSGQRDLFKEEK